MAMNVESEGQALEQRGNHWEQCDLCQGGNGKPIRYGDRRMDTWAVGKSERICGTEKGSRPK
jgi:hypothetical protein